MSLIYTDKDSVNRSNPSLNSGDEVTNRMAHGTTQAQNSIDDVDVDRLSIQERQIIAINNGVNKAVFGFLEDGSFGLKVAPDGTDVLTASDDELIFNSSQNVFKIVATGTGTTPSVSVAGPSSDGWAQGSNANTYSHGLGYIPAIIAFVVVNGKYILMPFTRTAVASRTNVTFITEYASADVDNVYLQTDITVDRPFGGSNSGGGSTVKYYLLQETAN